MRGDRWGQSPEFEKPKATLRFRALTPVLLSGDTQQLHFEHQRRLRRNDAGKALVAVGELGRDGEPALAAHLHAGHPLVQALDQLARAESEVQRVAAGELIKGLDEG